MLHEEITKDIIGAAIAVLNELKPGLDEKLYENAMVIELRARGHAVEQQREYPVHYRGQFIGKLIPDLIVDGKIIVDPKVATAFNDTHIAQMLGYLNITSLQVALLLNFKEFKLDWKRVVNERRNRTADDADNRIKNEFQNLLPPSVPSASSAVQPLPDLIPSSPAPGGECLPEGL
jgi:GxxExxY protein